MGGRIDSILVFPGEPDAELSGSPSPLTDLLPLLAATSAFVIEVGAVVLSLRNVLGQKLTRLLDAKAVLICAHVFILGIFALEYMRFFLTSSEAFILFYTLGVVSLILWMGILLTSLAYVIFLRPYEATFRERVVALVTRRLLPFGLLLILFVGYILAVDAYAVALRPFSFVTLRDFAGVTSLVPLFDGTFILLVLSLYTIFLLFPSVQFVLAIRRISDPQTKRAVSILVGGWDVIALDGLLMYGLLPSVGVNAMGPGQLVAGVVLGIMGFSMRRSSILADMFEPAKGTEAKGITYVINGQSKGKIPVSNYKGTMLLEADPAVNYERAVKEFALEMVASGRVVFAFTSRGSPVHLLLKEIPGLRFFILSESSYPKPSGVTLEGMVPRNDHAVLLSVMDETVTRSPEQAKAIIFDNISSLILDSGFQECYKFLRQVNEILSHGDIVSVFLVLSKAHDEKSMNLVKNLYSGHLTYDATGLHVMKKG